MNARLHQKITELMASPVAPCERSPASALPVFGQNLRLLTSLKGTQAKAAADLDIGRIQYQRYLRGSSFPKPHILRKICDYFRVDARILLEPLTEDLLREMLQARGATAQFSHREEWLSALGFAARDQDYFNESGALDEGVYAAWQWCGARKNTIIRRLFKVSRLNRALIMRGYAPASFYPPGTSLRDREYRGICLKLKRNGYVILSFSPRPSDMISTTFVTPMSLSEYSSEVFVGYTAISRDELPVMPRLSRVVIEKIDSSKENLCKQARIGTFFDIDEIPEVFADLLRLTVA